MTSCSECGTKYINGTLYCKECGLRLRPESGADFPTLEVKINGAASTFPLRMKRGFGVQADQVSFVISNNSRRVTLNMKDKIRIGRKDPNLAINPELDLTEDEGADHGVSREHAIVVPSEQGILLVDLDSTNGTLLNSFTLKPDRPYQLKNGDQIQFGTLVVQVYFE